MRTDELDFDLPPELIAQEPPAERSGSRLLHYRRQDRSITHRTFADLPRLLSAGDLLVFNDTRVVPARFWMRKHETGGLVEGLFLEQLAPNRWRVMLRNLGSYLNKPLSFGVESLHAHVLRPGESGVYEIEVNTIEPAASILQRIGTMPLPPYIRREKIKDPREASDRKRYQTVYAREPGAVAAPTAGLHFTGELMQQLEAIGVQRTFVTLHVGMGTFKPITADTLDEHEMHSEPYAITPDAANALTTAKRQSRRIIAVGTTSARVLESQPHDQPFEPKSDSTSIFIYPPYQWKHVGAMITNFHLPRSTLIAMIAALVDLDEQRRIYSEAIQQGYRFFSYGDAMFIE
jgi:S-adenosylmethionine:tRNA ribosyltransferase-isomerase